MQTKKKNWTTHLKPKSERKDSHATRRKKTLTLLTEMTLIPVLPQKRKTAEIH